jgi:hypothetical protein
VHLIIIHVHILLIFVSALPCGSLIDENSSGPYGCIGKQLALMELRAVTCLLVRRFDVRFAPDEDGSSLINKSVDAFTLRMGDLNLIFEERPHT